MLWITTSIDLKKQRLKDYMFIVCMFATQAYVLGTTLHSYQSKIGKGFILWCKA